MNEIQKLLQEAKNTHMTHIEDLTVLGGIPGIEKAIYTFEALLDQFQGFTPKNKLSASLKIDGSPSVLVWSSFPGLDKPGVSMKGLFAKNPKAAFTPQEVIDIFGTDRSGVVRQDLVNKLTTLLEYVPALGIPEGEIWQGDFLYDSQSLRVQTIHDEEYITFHPNTLVYAVKSDSDIAGDILGSKIGVAWHTVYTGTDLESSEASFTADASMLNYVPEVWSIDPYIKSLAGKITFTVEQTESIAALLDDCKKEKQFLSIDNSYAKIMEDDDFTTLFTQFQNYVIRQGGTYLKGSEFTDKFIEWGVQYLTTQKEKAIDKVKTEVGKERNRLKYEGLIQDFSDKVETYVETLDSMSELIAGLTQLKIIFTKRLETLAQFGAFLQTKDGAFSATGQEGFAISDMDGHVVKFVDRGEFSRANFSTDIVKGWENTRLSEALEPFNISIPVDSRIYDDSSKTFKRVYDAVDLGLPILKQLEYFSDLAITYDADTNKIHKNLPICYITTTDASISRSDRSRMNFANMLAQDLQVKGYTTSVEGFVTTVADSDGENIISFYIKPSSSASTSSTGSTNTETQEDVWAESIWCVLEGIPLPEKRYVDSGFEDTWKSSWEEGSKVLVEELTKQDLLADEEYVVCSSLKVHGYPSVENLMKVLITLPKDINFEARKANKIRPFEASNRDDWNPSDVFIVKKSKYLSLLQTFKDLIKDTTSVADINKELQQAMDNQSLIGVSLKQITNSPRVSYMNKIDLRQGASQTDQQFGSVTSVDEVHVHLEGPENTQYRSLRILLTMKEDDHEFPVEVQIRCSNNNLDKHNPAIWTVEPKYLGMKSQLGKTPSYILKDVFDSVLGREVATLKECLELTTSQYNTSPFSTSSPLYEKGMSILSNYPGELEKIYTITPANITLVKAFEDLMTSYDEKYGESHQAQINISKQSYKDLFKDGTNTEKVQAIRTLTIVTLLDFLELFKEAYIEGTFLDIFARLVQTAAKVGGESAPHIKLYG